MSYTQSIVTEIRRKTSGVFETPVKIGAEQRFVGALLNSHNNNLEEQSILGVDCITVTWTDNDIEYITKKFYNGDLNSISSNGYYILFIEDYSKMPQSMEYYFDNQGLYFPVYSTSGVKFEQQPDGSYALLGDNNEILSLDSTDNSLKVNPSYQVIKKEVLCLRTDITDDSDTRINSDIFISEKIISQKSDENNKIFVKQNIVNHLN